MNYKLYAAIEGDQYGFWTNPTKSKPSTFIPLGKAVFVKSITENIETNEVRLELHMDYMGNSRTITISREDLSDNRLIQALNKIGASAPKHRFDVLVESIMRQEADLEQNGYKPAKVYSHLGWIHAPMRDETGTIVGSQLHYRANRLLGGCCAKYDGPYSITPMGSFDAWRNMVSTQIIGHAPLELVLLASLSAVVNGLISPLTTGENPIFHLCGPSGCGKTTALYAATSVYGVPYEGEKRHANKCGEISVNRSIYGSWGATENATTAQCCGNHGAVIILNELGKFDGNDMTRIVYNLSEGTDKTRLDKAMATYTSEGYATTILSSGEISLLDCCKSKATGLQVRVMEISDKLTSTPTQARTIKEICRSHNGHAGPALAQYILGNGGCDMVLTLYNNYCQTLPAQMPPNSTSARFIEKYVAPIMTTAELATKALNLPFDTVGILKYFAEYEETTGQNRNVLTDSYKIILNTCRTNKSCFYCQGAPDPSIKVYGKITYPNTVLPNGQVIVEEYAIRRNFVEEVLTKNGFKNTRACYDEWNAMGVLDRDKDRPTRSRKIDPKAGKTEDVFVLRVYGDTLVTPPKKPKCKLVKRAIPSCSSQLATLLNDAEEAEENV